jgi:hypothetical protein
MKAIARCIAALALIAMPLSVYAQQNYKEGAVWRVTKVRILPGKTQDFYKALAYAPKVFDAEKAAGLIVDYTIFHSVSYEGPEKYDIALVIHYKNMAALDGLADRAEPVVAKVYGSPETRAQIAKLRTDSSETVSSELIRDIELLPVQ